MVDYIFEIFKSVDIFIVSSSDQYDQIISTELNTPHDNITVWIICKSHCIVFCNGFVKCETTSSRVFHEFILAMLI